MRKHTTLRRLSSVQTEYLNFVNCFFASKTHTPFTFKSLTEIYVAFAQMQMNLDKVTSCDALSGFDFNYELVHKLSNATRARDSKQHPMSHRFPDLKHTVDLRTYLLTYGRVRCDYEMYLKSVH